MYSGTGTSKTETYYGAYNRLVNQNKPQFACPQTNDLFTTKDSTKGNKALLYPIGLLTADEVAYAGGIAGGNYKNDDTTTYLKNYTNGLYHMMWTMTPYNFKNGSARVWYVDFAGSNTTEGSMCTADCLLDIRPVINLKSCVTWTSGNGSSDAPYEVGECATYLVDKILSDNTAYADNVRSEFVDSDTGIDFSAISSDTNGKGLYYTSTNTEDNKTTYYFSGAVENNYVQFGVYKAGTTVNGTTYNVDTPIYWKIIRINEDGSIRLIYNGTSTTATGSNVTIGNSNFNTNYDDNAYVGYMYGTPSSSTYALTHANTNDSTIKDYLDEWYIENLSSYSSYLADAGFCNDRSVASTSGTWYSNDTALGYAKNLTYYGAYNRLYKNKKPQFACPNASNDLFTTSTSSKGNKALTVPIGLITADEVWYAGATTSTNQTHYLYTGANYWTMSPRNFDGSFAYEWYVRSNGYLSYYVVNNSRGVRPVANLQSGVEIINGDGTSTSPYIVKTN